MLYFPASICCSRTVCMYHSCCVLCSAPCHTCCAGPLPRQMSCSQIGVDNLLAGPTLRAASGYRGSLTMLCRVDRSFLFCLQAGLVPGSYVGMGNSGTGCFTRGSQVSMGVHSPCLPIATCTCFSAWLCRPTSLDVSALLALVLFPLASQHGAPNLRLQAIQRAQTSSPSVW